MFDLRRRLHLRDCEQSPICCWERSNKAQFAQFHLFAHLRHLSALFLLLNMYDAEQWIMLIKRLWMVCFFCIFKYFQQYFKAKMGFCKRVSRTERRMTGSRWCWTVTDRLEMLFRRPKRLFLIYFKYLENLKIDRIPRMFSWLNN